MKKLSPLALSACLLGSTYAAQPVYAQDVTSTSPNTVQHVLLLSIDGMHAIDLYNCMHGIRGVNGDQPYCPNLAALRSTGVNYVATSTSKPSDSFPGIISMVSGATPKTMGVYYDVAYDRSLDAPAQTTGNGVAAGPCVPFGVATGTTTEYEEGVDIDQTKLNGGAPGASLTDGGIASIDAKRLVRNPANGCSPVYPWNFPRVNTVFGVIHAKGGYTAWADKHPAYSAVGGPGGGNVSDYYSPEVNSVVVALPGVTTSEGYSCATIRDTSNTSSWTNSFENIQCNDQLKVNAVISEIAGKTHSGAAAKVPALFGMDFQAVSVGQKLIEPGAEAGGYQNAAGAPAAELVSEIKYVDAAVGDMVQSLKDHGIYNDTLVIVTAKHGQSPVEPGIYKPNGTTTPATLLAADLPYSESPANPTGIGPTEDDISLLWLKNGVNVSSAVDTLQQNASAIGLGEIFYGPSVALNYNRPGTGPGEDPRTPDIIVVPNVGVTYSNSTKKHAEHGGFSHDDTNVLLLVSNPDLKPGTVSAVTTTAQVAPTILKALGISPKELDAVRMEGTAVLPGLAVKADR